MRWIGYATGALAVAYLSNLVAFFMLLYGLEYHASSFRHAGADVGVVILFPGTALSRDNIDPFVTGTFAWGVVIFAFLACRERKCCADPLNPHALPDKSRTRTSLVQ
jgi:hypothetical protein